MDRARDFNTRGNALARHGRLPEAALAYRRAIELDPAHAIAHNNLANVLKEQGDLEQSVVHYRRAAELAPERPEIQLNLGLALARTEDFSEAIAALKTAVRLKPGDPDVQAALGEATWKSGRIQEAIALLRIALANKPDDPEIHKNLGVALLQGGDADSAAAHLRAAIGGQPGYAEAYRMLCECEQLSPEDPETSRMEGVCSDVATSAADRARLHFALGKVYSDAGSTECAFAHYEQGNRLKRQDSPYDRAGLEAEVDDLIAFFTAERFQAVGDKLASASDLPIFIVGMPRSGTTLAEQILASHPQVHGGGELNDVHRLTRRMPALLGTSSRYPHCLAEVSPAVARAWGGRYLKSLVELAPSARHVTDKMPWNLFALGLIALLWPRGRVIHCCRDPLDTCVSCYTRYFVNGNEFSYDLADTGHYYRQYERLVRHWRAVLPQPPFEIQYERLTTDPETVVRRMLDHCGLAWDEDCLRFYENRRASKTNSLSIRQPLNTRSIGRWKRYESHLAPLISALSPDDLSSRSGPGR